MGDLVKVEREGAVAVIVLDRPNAMNALSRQLRRELTEVCASIATDETIHAVIVTGAGDRAFCAGLDLKELGSDTDVLRADDAERDAEDPVGALERLPQPVIGAINGVAITGGFELALACDILVASSNARFADTHARVGILPFWGLSQKLSRTIGASRAKELSFTGNFLDAETAHAWGLVNRVVTPETLREEAMRIARDIAGIDPVTIRHYKRLIDEGLARPLGEALAFEKSVTGELNAQVNARDVERRRADVQSRGRSQ